MGMHTASTEVRPCVRQHSKLIEGGGSFYGQVQAFMGVRARAEALEGCRTELKQILDRWLLLKFSQHPFLPEFDGINLTVWYEVA